MCVCASGGAGYKASCSPPFCPLTARPQQQKRRSPTHRRSQRRRTSTSRHWSRPCRLRQYQCWNTRRRCKGNPTHQHHAMSSADAPAARGGSRQAQTRSGSAADRRKRGAALHKRSTQSASGPSDGDEFSGGLGAGPCGLVAVCDVDRSTSGSCGHRGHAPSGLWVWVSSAMCLSARASLPYVAAGTDRGIRNWCCRHHQPQLRSCAENVPLGRCRPRPVCNLHDGPAHQRGAHFRARGRDGVTGFGPPMPQLTSASAGVNKVAVRAATLCYVGCIQGVWGRHICRRALCGHACRAIKHCRSKAADMSVLAQSETQASGISWERGWLTPGHDLGN